MKLKGQSLVDQGIGIMVAVIVIGAVAIPTSLDTINSVTSTKKVTNETEASSGSVPEIVTANTVKQGLVSGSENLRINDTFDNKIYELKDSEYEANYSSGEFNVTTADLDGDSDKEINSTNDEYLLTYEYKPDGYVGGITATVLQYVPLALAVGLFVAAISIVR